MAGNVEMHSAEERQLFERVLCQCGGCARLPLSNCICHWAEEKRAELRADLAAGKTVTQIQDAFAEQYGVKAIAIPRDKGLDRALWAVPIAAFVAAAGGIAYLGRRWVKRSQAVAGGPADASVGAAGEVRDDALDRELDAELKRFDEK
ncbi:MAG: cytochrome c-type biogenesis protein CcmH [Myxococcales bacterium]